jgi:hypothetical protein
MSTYRAYQVLHTLATDVVAFVLPVLIPGAEILVITSAYGVIRLYDSFELLICIGMCAIGLLTLLVLQLAIGFAVNVTESSDEFLRTGIHLNHGARALRQLDKKFFRSCRPLKWNIGKCYTLTRFTFPHIFDGIIIAVLINLLVAF